MEVTGDGTDVLKPAQAASSTEPVVKTAPMVYSGSGGALRVTVLDRSGHWWRARR